METLEQEIFSLIKGRTDITKPSENKKCIQALRTTAKLLKQSLPVAPKKVGRPKLNRTEAEKKQVQKLAFQRWYKANKERLQKERNERKKQSSVPTNTPISDSHERREWPHESAIGSRESGIGSDLDIEDDLS